MSGLLPEPAVSVSTMGLVINTSGACCPQAGAARCLLLHQVAAPLHAWPQGHTEHEKASPLCCGLQAWRTWR